MLFTCYHSIRALPLGLNSIQTDRLQQDRLIYILIAVGLLLSLFVLYRQRLLQLDLLRLKKKQASAESEASAEASEENPSLRTAPRPLFHGSESARKAEQERELIAVLAAAITAYESEQGGTQSNDSLMSGFRIRKIHRLS